MAHIQEIGPEIWTVKHPFSMVGLKLGTTTTIIRRGEELMLISPGPFEESQWKEVEALGRASLLIAPNKMHHLFLSEARERYPEARTLVAPGLAEKRPDLEGVAELPARLLDWGVDQRLLGGLPDLNETVFWHSSSKTLICTDLVFNFNSHPHFVTRCFLCLNGAHGTFGPTRVFKHLFLKDQKLLAADIKAILEWPVENIVLGHGEDVVGGGKARIHGAFGWLTLDS